MIYSTSHMFDHDKTLVYAIDRLSRHILIHTTCSDLHTCQYTNQCSYYLLLLLLILLKLLLLILLKLLLLINVLILTCLNNSHSNYTITIECTKKICIVGFYYYLE